MAESTDKFGVGVWDRWEFARELGAGRYPESSDAGTGRAAADVAFFNGDFGMAADLYKALSEHHPGNRGILARMLHCYDATCDWQAREPIADALTAALDIEPDLNGTEPLCYLSIPLSNRKAFEFVKARNARYGNKSTPQANASSACKSDTEKIRIGYLSIDFKAHNCGIPLWPVLAGHNHDRFHIIGYSLAGTDKKADVERTVAPICDAYRNLGHLSWRDVRTTIAKDRIDILVDMTRNIRGAPIPLFQTRLAPVQVSAWGYGGTSGIPLMDVIFSDETLIPQAEEAFCSEKVVRLPAYLPPILVAETHPPTDEERAEFGLPSGKVILSGFTNPYKLDKETFTAWLDILAAAPDSILWMMAGSESLQHALRAYAATRGIGRDRMVFAGHADESRHLRRFQHVDLVLDNPRMGSGSSVVHGLAAGRPVVTLQGTAPDSRGAESILSGLKLHDFAAPDWTAFVRLAAGLTCDPKARTRAHDRIRTAVAKNSTAAQASFIRTLEDRYGFLLKAA